MPRVAQGHKRGASGHLSVSPLKSPIKIPLNDDAQEKARRLQSRHALHDIQMNQIKAAASPVRKLTNIECAGSSSPTSNPKTPRRPGNETDLEGGFLMVGGNAVTPMKRVPLLANFEEWMKMATDNKINATNSWNFALIDYFHDLSLLKEGDSVNFQKASCTLDGCVKIYTSRVDSVATETGKLLSGLADSACSKGKKGNNQEGEDSEQEVLDEDGVVRKRPKKTVQRTSTETLASSFASLQLKKIEVEFSVDPLFKKASADFDEGGAKGLLLNHLSIDSQGRIVFDSSDDAVDTAAEISAPNNADLEMNGNDVTTEAIPKEEEDEEEIDIKSLGFRFLPNLDVLEDQDICHSLKNLDLDDPSNNTDIPFLKAPEDWRQDKEKSLVNEVDDFKQDPLLDNHQFGFDDDDDGPLGCIDLPEDAGLFGEGGEVWARDASIETRIRVKTEVVDHDGIEGTGVDDGDINCDDISTSNYITSLNYDGKTQIDHDDVLSYFDEALRKNWAGPEHWRIRKIKDIDKPVSIPKARKEKEPYEIDFYSPLSTNLVETIYTQTSVNGASCLPKKERRAKNKNLLPDDKHFNSKRLLRLFLKPHSRWGCRRIGYKAKSAIFNSQNEDEVPTGEINEAFWARKQGPNDTQDGIPTGNYDADFFQDAGLPMAGGIDDDDMDFADAHEHTSPSSEERRERGIDDATSLLGSMVHASDGDRGAFGSQLVTQNRRLRPEYVQYARVAKKIDVRRLKEELWKSIGYDNPKTGLAQQTPGRLLTPEPEPNEFIDEPFKFTSIMQSLRSAYPKQVMDDISTSYCFICLLHLANEKGLLITKQEGLLDLDILRDKTAEIAIGE